ncbi:MAG: hypothetical protein ACREJ3_12930, partial [Polyangiaceae bacterium]
MARMFDCRLLRCLACASIVLAMLSLTGAARAGTSAFEAALAGFGKSDPDAVASAAKALGATEDPRALGVLQALEDGNLTVDAAGRVFVHDASGALHDAATGALAGGDGGHAPLVDNEVRRVLEPIIEHLQLRSPDVDVRLAAVD